MSQKIVDSKAYPLKELFQEKFDVDFYQREYVWEKKHLEDLVNDLSNEFLKNYRDGDSLEAIRKYDPYFMGEIVVSTREGKRGAIIDGQQRITTLTLLLMYILRTFGGLAGFPVGEFQRCIYDNDLGTFRFNLDIPVRRDCMLSLYNNGSYIPTDKDKQYVQNIVDRYNDIDDCWNANITQDNVINFSYWLYLKVVFSKVWTNNDDFAYVIFETMNDRGLSLTPVEMLRSYLLANIDEDKRDSSIELFDGVIKRLTGIKLSSKAKAEDFFKIYFRGHYAEDLSQAKNAKSDFVLIGQGFHRWVRDKKQMLHLSNSADFVQFINEISYFAIQYEKINQIVSSRDANKYLYAIVNDDYGFTMQPALILSSINYNDSPEIVEEKIQIVTKYLTQLLSWRVWKQSVISQSSLEYPIYLLCKTIRGLDVESLKLTLQSQPIDLPILDTVPILNQQNRSKIRVLLALITEIVAKQSNESDYMLNKPEIEVEHIWSNHFEQHLDEFNDAVVFANLRNNIGDLLVLPKSFNTSYGDKCYADKVKQYFSQNILAQTLNEQKYTNSPAFIRFKESSGLSFKSYTDFKQKSIIERAELYKAILVWNWSSL